MNQVSQIRPLIVGPECTTEKIGGVIRHITILKTLNSTKNATFYDPGSSNGLLNLRAVSIGLRCLKFGTIAKKMNHAQIWINSSIYDTAIVKLIFILFSLRNYRTSIVRVFFHGGRFSKLKILKSDTMRSLVSRTLDNADIYHFLSREQGEEFQKILKIDRWQLFKNFSDSSNVIQNRKHPKKIFLFVGRLVKEKGIRTILSSIDLIYSNSEKKSATKDLEFWFAGEGPEEEFIRTESENRLKGTVFLLGRLSRKQLNEVYSKAFALLLPSYQEGYPFVIIEAMQAGLPIISCSTGAIPDLVREGQNGFLIPVKDSNLLAQAMRCLIENDQLWYKISQNNKDFFQDHLSRSAAENYYRGLIDEKINSMR